MEQVGSSFMEPRGDDNVTMRTLDVLAHLEVTELIQMRDDVAGLLGSALGSWDVALQVAPAKYERGRSWIHVGGATEGGLAPAAKAGLKTVALGDATAPDATARIARLSELPDAIDGLVAA